MEFTLLKAFLDQKVDHYNRPEFIEKDPISIPHLFTKEPDIEIAGFFAAIFAWGQRITILNKTKALMQLMDHAPHDFICNHKPTDLKKMMQFKHRTFNADDLLYFLYFLQQHYKVYPSLANAFFSSPSTTTENALCYFKNNFFRFPHLHRTQKHIASPLQNASCKRLNMYLRWMVRKDKHGVDFGIWNFIAPSDLICPLDIHVGRVARQLGLLTNDKNDWKAALELTGKLRNFDDADPVKYDFALFNIGIVEQA